MIADFNPILITPQPMAGAEETTRQDTAILDQCHIRQPWGLSTTIDLSGCDPSAIRDAAQIARFVVALCELIQMQRYGDPIIVRFGADPRVCGYSLVQLIETSLIAGHFAEESDSAYIDIFSCKPYPPHQAAAFCRDWFGAQSTRLSITLRHA
ncbi:MAG: S-adenosylmethionine decarboxylase family protein [Chloroflexaceae bacterium]